MRRAREAVTSLVKCPRCRASPCPPRPVREQFSKFSPTSCRQRKARRSFTAMGEIPFVSIVVMSRFRSWLLAEILVRISSGAAFFLHAHS
jgi:hypothetical protein